MSKNREKPEKVYKDDVSDDVEEAADDIGGAAEEPASVKKPKAKSKSKSKAKSGAKDKKRRKRRPDQVFPFGPFHQWVRLEAQQFTLQNKMEPLTTVQKSASEKLMLIFQQRITRLFAAALDMARKMSGNDVGGVLVKEKHLDLCFQLQKTALSSFPTAHLPKSGANGKGKSR
jgi:histone H3/H4